jgi:hypothetical protein
MASDSGEEQFNPDRRAQEGRDHLVAPLLSWEFSLNEAHFQLQPLVEPQPSQT